MRPDHRVRLGAERGAESPERSPAGGGTAGGVEATAPVVRAHLWVSGRVQGVGFRDFVRRQAVPLGLGGFVRNLPDRRVEVVAEGSRASVEALIAAVRQGPVGASVREVEVVWEAPQGASGFVIQIGGLIYD